MIVADRPFLRPRLLVVAPDTARAVRFAGGWLFDLVMAGWDATVGTVDRPDPRPLRILGARAVDLGSQLVAPVRGPGPQALAIDADLVEADPRVRRLLANALAERVAEVRLWGDRRPASLTGTTGEVRHRLSVAARAFKAQALAAATGDVEPGDDAELFRDVAMEIV